MSVHIIAEWERYTEVFEDMVLKSGDRVLARVNQVIDNWCIAELCGKTISQCRGCIGCLDGKETFDTLEEAQKAVEGYFTKG
jgi:hypothetical protein